MKVVVPRNLSAIKNRFASQLRIDCLVTMFKKFTKKEGDVDVTNIFFFYNFKLLAKILKNCSNFPLFSLPKYEKITCVCFQFWHWLEGGMGLLPIYLYEEITLNLYYFRDKARSAITYYCIEDSKVKKYSSKCFACGICSLFFF